MKVPASMGEPTASTKQSCGPRGGGEGSRGKPRGAEGRRAGPNGERGGARLPCLALGAPSSGRSRRSRPLLFRLLNLARGKFHHESLVFSRQGFPKANHSPSPSQGSRRRHRLLVLPQLRAPDRVRASRAEGGGRREGGCRWQGKGGGQPSLRDTLRPSGKHSSGSEQTRHKGGSRRSCQSAALPVTGVAPPPPPPPPPPPQSPALPGPVCLWPVVQRGRRRRRRRWRRDRDALRLRARGPARPRPLLPGWLWISDPGAVCLARTEGRAGPATGRGPAIALLLHSRMPSIRALCMCVCMRVCACIYDRAATSFVHRTLRD
jgi:hypothetical protein